MTHEKDEEDQLLFLLHEMPLRSHALYRNRKGKAETYISAFGFFLLIKLLHTGTVVSWFQVIMGDLFLKKLLTGVSSSQLNHINLSHLKIFIGRVTWVAFVCGTKVQRL